MDQEHDSFGVDFAALMGFQPFSWQRRLYSTLRKGTIPAALDLPTGLGKTSVMALWLMARMNGASLPRRLVYIVDRRAVVDQATAEAEKLRASLERNPALAARLGLDSGVRLPISTLRGRFIDNREWLADPASPAIVVGTVDMIGSRLLFSGYGVSRRMRPYHAGLLGVDALVVLDEAHLVPPFEKLLEAIENGGKMFGPRAEQDRGIVPPFRLLSLSATGRDRTGEVFRLADTDVADVARRLHARKIVRLAEAGDAPLEEVLVERAWSLAEAAGFKSRCLVYCDRRGDAEKVATAIEKRAGTRDMAIELFVGARRARERQRAMDWLKEHGYVAGSGAAQQQTFLVATSAGEVGVDLDADHMVCDLVPWERMVQRLGRVNRRGDGDARIEVVEKAVTPKKKDAPTPAEARALIGLRVPELIRALPPTSQGFDANPAALRALKREADGNQALAEKIRQATTPAPLRPALSRPLVEAWAMTSLEDHPGRPKVEPWLRGWESEDEPQTSVVWRRWLPVRRGEAVADKEIEAFFEAAPIHASELLETETSRSFDWLSKRTKRVAAGLPEGLKPGDVVAIVLTPAGEVDSVHTVSELARAERGDLRLAGQILVVDARLGGLDANGLLDDNFDEAPSMADANEVEWLPPDERGRPVVRFRIHSDRSPEETAIEANETFVFATERTADGEDTRVHIIETWTTEESRATAIRPQLLNEHQSWTAEQAVRLAKGLGLPAPHGQALAIAARLHDEGKRAVRWQRAFNAARDGEYAKTRGPVRIAQLGGYRHELGSLPRAVSNGEFRDLPDDARQFVLHLIAAHHGFARPLITIEGCDDAPPSMLQRRAQEVALRFADMQQRWGLWGLAWWEALLRAADQQASRRNDAAEGANG